MNNHNASNQDITERFLEFSLGNENYAIPLLTVKEVIPVPETTEIPNSPKYFIGIMNLRGQIISVIDLRKKLKVQSQKNNPEEAVVIINIGTIGLGVIVDSINRVLTLGRSDFSEIPEIETQVNAKYIKGIYHKESHLTVLLDIAKSLDLSDFEIVEKQVA